MGLFSKTPNADKILELALADYRSENYSDCYAKVCQAADLGSARANFCKALLLYNDNVSSDEVDVDQLLALTKKAIDGGYSLAYGFYAYLLHASGDMAGLRAFCSAKNKVKDGVYSSFKASYYFGLYTDEEQADQKTILATTHTAIELLKELNEQIQKGKTEALEYACYNPYSKFKLNYTYAHAQYILMTILYCENDWNNRREFMAAFDEVLSYMPVADEKYRASSLYLDAVLNNYLGLNDFKEANRAMGIVTEAFEALSDEDAERHRQEYNELYDQYDAFYDSESEKRSNREVTYSDGYADENALSLKNIAAAISSGVQHWASSPSSSSSNVYTINGTEYTRGDMGYLYDSSGFKSAYRVDDYARLYDDNENELGYFNTNGNFISN